MNLIHNAIDAVKEGEGVVELTSEYDGTALRFTVRDNGTGIPPTMRNKLFLPFQTTKAKGTGLGLSIAYKIVRAHGGDITVDSDGRSYTIFQVTI
jgi:two-component system sensor histidine kinase FlrB